MKITDSTSASLLRAFRCAAHGIVFALARERNLRIHFAAGAFVLYFSRFYAFSQTELALLILCIGLVITTELINTAIERTVDLCSPDIHPLAGMAKDIAAGAVLLCALVSVVVGVLLLWDIPTLRQILLHISQQPLLWLAFAAIALWIVWPLHKNRSH